MVAALAAYSSWIGLTWYSHRANTDAPC